MIPSRSPSRTTAKASPPPISPTSSSGSTAPIPLAPAPPAEPAWASPFAKPQLKMPVAQFRSPAIQGRELRPRSRFASNRVQCPEMSKQRYKCQLSVIYFRRDLAGLGSPLVAESARIFLGSDRRQEQSLLTWGPPPRRVQMQIQLRPDRFESR